MSNAFDTIIEIDNKRKVEAEDAMGMGKEGIYDPFSFQN